MGLVDMGGIVVVWPGVAWLDRGQADLLELHLMDLPCFKVDRARAVDFLSTGREERVAAVDGGSEQGLGGVAVLPLEVDHQAAACSQAVGAAVCPGVGQGG